MSTRIEQINEFFNKGIYDIEKVAKDAGVAIGTVRTQLYKWKREHKDDVSHDEVIKAEFKKDSERRELERKVVEDKVVESKEQV